MRVRRLMPISVGSAVAVICLLSAVVLTTGGAATAAGTTVSVERRTGPPLRDTVTVPTVRAPATAGKGAPVLQIGTKPDVANFDYETKEVFFSGTATSYTSAQPLASDGNWTVTEVETAPYSSRMVLHRPKDPDDFNGTVFVEWLNVTGGFDYGAMHNYAGIETMRSGAVWVGVSAQQVGIEGDGSAGGGSAVALKNADPERYGELHHPGDAWSYDIFTQAGAAIWFDRAVLGGLKPTRMIAFGWSQSGSRLTTYVNAVAPSVHVYNAYLLRSRFGFAAPLGIGAVGPPAARIRTDLDVPVFVLETEGDVLNEGLGYAPARQPDTRLFRSWEVTGAAHGDTYSHGLSADDDGSIATDRALFNSMFHPPTEVNDGAIKCARPINAGPAAYVLRAVLRHVDTWARDGTAPPKQPPIELAPGDHDAVRDERGNALGGVRTPHVDVPVATLSGIGNSCFLFGTTAPFDAATLAAAYDDHAAFVAAWNKATTKAVRHGVILAEDAKRLRAVAKESSVGA
jgi:hypothetical protein